MKIISYVNSYIHGYMLMHCIYLYLSSKKWNAFSLIFINKFVERFQTKNGEKKPVKSTQQISDDFLLTHSHSLHIQTFKAITIFAGYISTCAMCMRKLLRWEFHMIININKICWICIQFSVFSFTFSIYQRAETKEYVC